MSEHKHTPGPWKVELNKRAWGWVEVVGPSFAVHGPTQATDLRLHDEVKRIADARLIAAAPDLLEAVKEAMPFLVEIARQRHGHFSIEMADKDSTIGKMRDAIAKAEGRWLSDFQGGNVTRTHPLSNPAQRLTGPRHDQ